jgi:hypothetical protein
VVYRATWSGARPELFLIRPESRQSGSIGLGNAGIFSVSSRGDLAVALGCRLNWGECLGTLAQVPITGGSPREMVKDVIAADWSPDGQTIAVVSFNDSAYRLEYPLDKVLYQPKGGLRIPVYRRKPIASPSWITINSATLVAPSRSSISRDVRSHSRPTGSRCMVWHGRPVAMRSGSLDRVPERVAVRPSTP